MARSRIDGLPSPHPVLETLPGLYQDDDFLRRFLGAFDDALAPVFALLDGGFAAHLDPELAPGDFLPWLAGWLGLTFEEEWPEAQRRVVVAGIVELYRWRGTVRGLVEAVAMFSGEIPEILESGGVAWSATPGGDTPGLEPPRIVVRVGLDPTDGAALRRIERVVALAKPAHIAHRVEVR